MDYHLERKIRLDEDSECSGLYPWSLQEINETGEKIGKDQIPWAWSLYFTANELSHNYSVDIEKSYESRVNENTGLTQENEVITAVLIGSLEDNVSYSMFGTNRVINQFGLRIHKLEDGNDQEKCSMWGCASYTSEMDFRYNTTDDEVIIYLYLSKRFLIFSLKLSFVCWGCVKNISLPHRAKSSEEVQDKAVMMICFVFPSK